MAIAFRSGVIIANFLSRHVTSSRIKSTFPQATRQLERMLSEETFTF